MGVLLKTPVADLGEMEHAFDDAEYVFNPATNVGLETILGALDLVYDALVPITAVREAAGLRRLRPDHRLLTLLGRVTPDLGLFAVEQIGQDRGIVGVGSSRYDRMDYLGFTVHAYMSLHAEVPLVALLGLVHVGVQALSLFLVDEGALMMVASTIVPLVTLTPRIATDGGAAFGSLSSPVAASRRSSFFGSP